MSSLRKQLKRKNQQYCIFYYNTWNDCCVCAFKHPSIQSIWHEAIQSGHSRRLVYIYIQYIYFVWSIKYGCCAIPYLFLFSSLYSVLLYSSLCLLRISFSPLSCTCFVRIQSVHGDSHKCDGMRSVIRRNSYLEASIYTLNWIRMYAFVFDSFKCIW